MGEIHLVEVQLQVHSSSDLERYDLLPIAHPVKTA